MKIPLKKHWTARLTALRAEQADLEQRLNRSRTECAAIMRALVLDADGPAAAETILAVFDGDESYLVATPKPEPTTPAADPPAPGHLN